MSVEAMKLQRLEEIVEELRDLNQAFTSSYGGGNNLHQEIVRLINEIGTATFEISRIATALEKIQEALE